jgi:23S rRNA (cytidine1920-2'-O)/16S rRNA (cytidine1409-2'-O)-methyltransferase
VLEAGRKEPNRMPKIRLDVLMMERGLVESRSQAQKLVMAGQVRVQGQVVLKSADRFAADVEIVVDHGPRYVSRGGEKLEAALDAFSLSPLEGVTCVDVGASTGGFTDCLLQHGAGKVYAVDVGYGELHWKLRNDRRVVVMERTNARYVEGFPEPIALATVDASFISLRILLPVVRDWLQPEEGQVVALIKPQFEAGRQEVSRGDGVIQDARIHHRVLQEVLAYAQAGRFIVLGLIRSPLKGPKGNTEFLVHLSVSQQASPPAPVDAMIEAVIGPEE